ncbi:c-type cytochrome [Sphingomonas endophytica]|uniref:Cytochrome C n=1 Tax=Sphingomonas endophytica TaxID=869719 RepID=A0A147I385_9SPHN|nr:c-type cytochrome [Sphingomonas endophytica]KTT72443.1 cytochrome C [Sphingomonas endophytica]
MRRVIVLAALLAAGCSRDDSAERRARLGPNPGFAQLMRVADAEAGARRFGQCAACHSIAAGGQDRNGPNLHGVYGAKIGQNSARFGYTEALQAQAGTWDAARLDRWLADPRGMVPGTSMAFPGVRDPLDRADLIAYLKTQS